jgi:hypothetical protein
MTYLTDFNSIQITGEILGSGNINIGGNIQANNQTLTTSSRAGRVTVAPDPLANGNTSFTVAPAGNLNFSGANYVFQSNLTISALQNLRIPGGSGEQFLTTDGNGSLSWAVPQGQGNGVVGGGVQALQVNNGYGFGGDVGNLYANISVDATDPNATVTTVTQLNVNVPLVLGNSITGNAGLIANTVDAIFAANTLFISGGSNNQVLYADSGSQGAVRWGNLPTNPPGGIQGSLQFLNNTDQFSGTANLVLGTDNANVTNLSIRSNVLAFSVTGNVANVTSTGNVSIATTGNLTLPTVAKVKVAGGSNNFVLTTDGQGNLSWSGRTVYSVTNVANAGPFLVDPASQDIVTANYAGLVSVILPTPASNTVGSSITIKDTWGGGRATSPITISVNGGSTIDGQSSVQVTGDYNSIQLAQLSATNWGVI